MSRIANKPIFVPKNVDIKIYGQCVTIKNNDIILTRVIHKAVKIDYMNNVINVLPRNNILNANIQAGTARALLNIMIIGVTKGFTKHLKLVGVGYRATLIENDNKLNLNVGFSHSIIYKIPKGIIVYCPNQNEIIFNGADKQLVGQVAADIRSIRSPDPYKGKGIHYINEIVHLKEAKKK